MLLIQTKITLLVDGAAIEGEFVQLQPNGITVRPCKPIDKEKTHSLPSTYLVMFPVSNNLTIY
ncbi:MAG: hypothetical protein P8O06_07800 [Porticoccaceae bacterium]|nr:hypothetical protein [Porticoccaceae bacterium]